MRGCPSRDADLLIEGHVSDLVSDRVDKPVQSASGMPTNDGRRFALARLTDGTGDAGWVAWCNR